MILLKTKLEMLPQVLSNCMHAADKRPSVKKDEIILIYLTKKRGERSDKKRIQYAMIFDHLELDDKAQSKAIWGKQWKYLIVGKEIIELEVPFNFEDLGVTHRKYLNAQWTATINEDDEKNILKRNLLDGVRQLPTREKETNTNTWIFQGNPDNYEIDKYLTSYSYIYWSVTKYQKEIKLGDKVYIWRAAGSGKVRKIPGIIAEGIISEEPKLKSEVDKPEYLNTEGWVITSDEKSEIKAGIAIDSVRINPGKGMLTKRSLENDPILKNLQVITVRTGSNFKMKDIQIERLNDEWAKKENYSPRSLMIGDSYRREEVHSIFNPENEFISRGGPWGVSGIAPIPEREASFVFFVTFGEKQGDHVFEEHITEDGVLSWQSQPKQSLSDMQISQFISHNEEKDNIYLFLRPHKSKPYTYSYLGKLKYLNHDETKENPVYFHWQLMDWEHLPKDVAKKLDIVLPAEEESDLDNFTPGNLIQEENPFIRPLQAKKKKIFKGQSRKRSNYDLERKRNKILGEMGELSVIKWEEKRLKQVGLPHLAARIKHVSKTEGDGAGYDIESFNSDNTIRYIEVKTTEYSINTPYHISINELLCSEQLGNNYFLYRVYNFNRKLGSGNVHVVNGNVSNHSDLEPTKYRGRLLPIK